MMMVAKEKMIFYKVTLMWLLKKETFLDTKLRKVEKYQNKVNWTIIEVLQSA